MPGITKEVRTIMYSVEPNGHVAVHQFPFDANDMYGMEKLQRFVKRGFTFADPRTPGSPNTPQVIVTGVVDLAKPVPVEQVNEAEGLVESVDETEQIKKPVIATASSTFLEAYNKASEQILGRSLTEFKQEIDAELTALVTTEQPKVKPKDLPKRKYTKHKRRVKK